MWKKRGNGRKNRTPKDEYRPWNAAILAKQPESNISDNNRNSREIKETSGEEFTAAAVLGSDVPPEKETFRYWNVVGLGIVEPKKPFEKHWTHSEAQKNINSREDDEVMNDTQEPSELVPRHENQYKPFSNRQDAPRHDAPRQDAPRQDAPRQDASWHDAPRQDVPRSRQDAPRQNTSWQDAPRQNTSWQDAPRQDVSWQDAPRQDASWQDAPRQDASWQDAPRQDASRQDARQYRNDNIKRSSKDAPAKSNIAEVTFRLVGSGFRRAEALIVDINSSNSPNMSSSYYPNSSSSSPASVNSPSTPDDPLLSPLLELNEALMSQVKTMKTQDSSKGPDLVKAKPDKGGWKENWAQGYGNIW
ncbi:5281_t:CDS:2 [Paraglomus brasilianum]|uniref:5281_t:CDS:1 n=1 Tax=Paraglomus brasilianum TaxID=144538 RepID=A0A9N8Z9J3_9GLOM|nr:5281_t:CDS:2 [Paraglomus brasilianum]